MRRKIRRAALVASFGVLVMALGGCATSGVFPTAHLTTVQLDDGDYRLVATNVTGEAEAGYLLGLSGGFFSEMRTLALVRVSGTGLLYSEALEDLWANFRREHGAVENRRLALVNVRFDGDAQNLLVYTRPKIRVRADVVEFGR